MPRPERRAEVALLAVRSGLVGADEGGGRHAGVSSAPYAGVCGGADDDGVTRGVRDFEPELGDGDVLVEVAYSSVNYKDGLATIGKRPGGADLAAGAGDRPGRDGGRRRRCSRTAMTWASPSTAATRSTRACRPTGSCRCRTG